MEITNNSIAQQMQIDKSVANEVKNNAPKLDSHDLSEFMAESKDNEEVKAFMKSLLATDSDKEFEAESLAESAPESIQAYAEEHGINLSQFISDQHESRQSGNEVTNNSPVMSSASAANQYAMTEEMALPESGLAEKMKASVAIEAQA